MNIAEMHKFIVTGALSVIATGEEHNPMAFFHSAHSTTAVALTPVFHDKALGEALIKTMAEQLKPDLVGFISEAWMASTSNWAGQGSLANQPGSIEILMITIETKIKIEGWMYPIVIDDAGARLLDMDGVIYLDGDKAKVASRFSVFGHNDRSEINEN